MEDSFKERRTSKSRGGTTQDQEELRAKIEQEKAGTGELRFAAIRRLAQREESDKCKLTVREDTVGEGEGCT